MGFFIGVSVHVGVIPVSLYSEEGVVGLGQVMFLTLRPSDLVTL